MSVPGDEKRPASDGWGARDASHGEESPSAPGTDGAPAREVGEPSSGEARTSKPRKRITLRVPAQMLDLPGDTAAGAPTSTGWDDELGSAELALPADDGLLEPAAAEPAVDDDDDRDGWARSRPTASIVPPAPRPRSELPAQRSAESTDSLRLVSARSRPVASPPDLAAEMNDRFALGDFTGALRAAELLLGQRPDDTEASQVAQTSRERLVHFHLARVGGLGAVLDVKVAGAEVRWLGLDHRAGFLLSLVDGTTSVEEIVDLSGMPKHEALRLLAELLDGGAISRIA